ncbi:MULTISPECIES: Glu/Leu/Phe/Val dehydrogenase dimerization domain-containing protein [Serratia]|uniref:Glu/Leu/Phe/Val dehydrogenase dimerization domain-containing protein n=1 Tax=Serratia TaxID=613 RepID=UPI000EFCA2F8|nr:MULTISPECIES: Glu/Leu/Phe/Val dehydrogenase dimerization domain-containing protein [Serratia]AYO38126.1 Glu/Leu/Phe/Val dehydrogenase [Serratia sp. P2ACOL2]MBB1584465.1 Glu/Leu/Phe/Val dehydrogenase [Serratia sp. OS31]WBL72947.1 Glu/Leu/Phe/Val dehydrogenase [Serratia liquefaciens]HBK4766846.1 Glu/Leu/Phe/Val dehydrogenase [Serratia liquefaciens]
MSVTNALLNTRNHYQVETVEVDDETSFTLAYSSQIKLLPANGGIRWRAYASRQLQEEEAIMLAQRMSLKHGLYNTGFSGGKIVVNSKRSPKEQPAVLEAIGELLNRYGGTMFTGCDINTGNREMDYLRQFTPWILNAMDSPQVDTSVATGYGVWSSIKKVLILRLNHLSRARVAIHGMGKVGSEVAKQCLLFGCEVVGYDINPAAVFPDGVQRVTEDQLLWQPSDVLCIASLSGILTLENVELLNTRWVISSANSPFGNLQAEQRLLARGVHYLPDYVSNAGAVICDSIEMAFTERYNQMNQEQVNAYVHSVIGAKTEELLQRAHLLDCDVGRLLQPIKSALMVA